LLTSCIEVIFKVAQDNVLTPLRAIFQDDRADELNSRNLLVRIKQAPSCTPKVTEIKKSGSGSIPAASTN